MLIGVTVMEKIPWLWFENIILFKFDHGVI